ncbi:MAG: hypothetical protein R3C10_27740 [Pirellulales bacterium]
MSTDRYRKWNRWLKRIEREQLHDLLVNRHIFKQLQECTAPYAGKYHGVGLFDWMVQNYVAFASTAIRRITERPKVRWSSISLRILLEDLADNDSVLTRQRFKSLYRNSVALRFADRDFNGIARSQSASHITASRIRRDINAITRICAPVERLTNKVVAHTEADRRKVGKIKYDQIDEAIDLIEVAFQRYSLLICGSICNPLVPLDDFDVRPELKKIWA